MISDIKIAYIGGGSKMWANIFMRDLSLQSGLCGEIGLYDIDREAANKNKIYGEIINECDNVVSKWNYVVYEKIDDVLNNANVVIISILPGTFEEMASDVHAPEKYGIYQSVGDTVGPGGILRAMRTVPIYELFAKEIKNICPNAWVINLTNPMAICVKTLYDVFPEIKAFGCCHEVFNAQLFLTGVVEKILKIDRPSRKEIKANIAGINHFTWMSEAYYKNINIFDIFPKFIDKYFDEGYYEKGPSDSWKTDTFTYGNKVKMDLFNKYHVLAAAGDRHLVEFFNNNIYLKDIETINYWHFGLTTVENRIKKQNIKIQELDEVINKNKKLELKTSTEEAVNLIKAVLGFENVISNVNLPNNGQINFLPRGAIVESNCLFSYDSVKPLETNELPCEVQAMILRNCLNTEDLYQAIKERALEKIFMVFINEPLCSNINVNDAKKLFSEMLINTSKYLDQYYELNEFIK